LRRFSLKDSDMVVVKATVEKIDYEKRVATLKGPHGNLIDIKVDKAAKNLDQVKVGDQVIAEYYETTAIFVRKSNEPAGAAEVAMVEMAPKGKKPAGIVVNITEVTATVEAIDYHNRTVTLRGPQGKMATLNVDPRVKKFKQVKVGDELVVRHTEAIAIKVQKPQ
jgi:putative lipoic acid-binding regulatory protein